MKGKHKQSENRRNQIIQAGLRCFTKNGYTASTMAEICREAKASTGSVYHHYKSKEQLATAVYLEGIINFQEGYIKGLLSGISAQGCIRNSIANYIYWVKENPEWAKFLFYQRNADFMQNPNEELNSRNKNFTKTLCAWFNKYTEAGILKKMSWDIFLPQLIGPSQDYTKHYLSGMSVTPVEEAVEILSTAAWDALKI